MSSNSPPNSPHAKTTPQTNTSTTPMKPNRLRNLKKMRSSPRKRRRRWIPMRVWLSLLSECRCSTSATSKLWTSTSSKTSSRGLSNQTASLRRCPVLQPSRRALLAASTGRPLLAASTGRPLLAATTRKQRGQVGNRWDLSCSRL